MSKNTDSFAIPGSGMTKSYLGWAVLSMSLLCGATVQASPVYVSLNGSGSLTQAVNSDPYNSTVDVLAVPGTYSYQDSYGSASGGSSFVDSFLIQVAPNSLDAITTTIDVPMLGISGLKSRLFAFDPTNPADSPIPTTGSFNGSWTQVVFSQGQTTGYVNVLLDNDVTAGFYVLQIAGTLASGGGSYGGNLDLSPVPLPAALPLFMSGLALFALRRRRKL